MGYVHNQNKGVTGTGNLFIPNVQNAVGPSFMDGDVARCGTRAMSSLAAPRGTRWHRTARPATARWPIRPLQAYLYLPSHDTYTNTTKAYSANIGGSLFSLPAGELAIAAGYEHREESGEYNPDALLQSGLSTDLAGKPTKGSYKLDEFYVELNVPVLADMPFAKELSLDMAGRYSDYNTFGDTINSKFGLKWKPIDDLVVRATYSTGFRAPSIADMYGGTSQTFDAYTDPCDSSFGSAARNPVAAPARAWRSGQLPPDHFRRCTVDRPGHPVLQRLRVGFQPGTEAGNLKTWTAGLVYSPNFVQGLDVSLDWWKIRIDNVIAAESVTSILNQLCAGRGVGV